MSCRFFELRKFAAQFAFQVPDRCGEPLRHDLYLGCLGLHPVAGGFGIVGNGIGAVLKALALRGQRGAELFAAHHGALNRAVQGADLVQKALFDHAGAFEGKRHSGVGLGPHGFDAAGKESGKFFRARLRRGTQAIAGLARPGSHGPHARFERPRHLQGLQRRAPGRALRNLADSCAAVVEGGGDVLGSLDRIVRHHVGLSSDLRCPQSKHAADIVGTLRGFVAGHRQPLRHASEPAVQDVGHAVGAALDMRDDRVGDRPHPGALVFQFGLQLLGPNAGHGPHPTGSLADLLLSGLEHLDDFACLQNCLSGGMVGAADDAINPLARFRIDAVPGATHAGSGVVDAGGQYRQPGLECLVDLSQALLGLIGHEVQLSPGLRALLAQCFRQRAGALTNGVYGLADMIGKPVEDGSDVIACLLRVRGGTSGGLGQCALHIGQPFAPSRGDVFASLVGRLADARERRFRPLPLILQNAGERSCFFGHRIDAGVELFAETFNFAGDRLPQRSAPAFDPFGHGTQLTVERGDAFAPGLLHVLPPPRRGLGQCGQGTRCFVGLLGNGFGQAACFFRHRVDTAIEQACGLVQIAAEQFGGLVRSGACALGAFAEQGLYLGNPGLPGRRQGASALHAVTVQSGQGRLGKFGLLTDGLGEIANGLTHGIDPAVEAMRHFGDGSVELTGQ